MNQNPYASPNLNGLPKYFTDDITLLPVGVIWASMCGQPLVPRTTAFLYFVARKALRQRMPAYYGTRYPPRLTAIEPEQLPAEAEQPISQHDESCRAAGLQHFGYYLPSWIGFKRGVLSIWTDPNHTMWSTTIWFEITLGEHQNTRTVFSCHSETTDETELHTAAQTMDVWISQMIPPGVEIHRLAADASISEIIEHHRNTIADRTDLAPFDPASLRSLIEQRSQEQIDFLLFQRLYAELTPAEIERLQRAAD